MSDIRRVLADLGLSESEADVYLAMNEGAASAQEIGKLTRRKRPTIYYALNALAQRGLVSKTDADQRKVFRAEPLTSLSALAAQRVREAVALAETVKDMEAMGSKRSPTERPQVSFFEGVEAVKTRIMYTLYNRSGYICSIVPEPNFFWQMGQQFVKDYVEERVKKNIRTRSLWERNPGKEMMQKYYAALSDVRLLPPDMQRTFTTTVLFYDDKTLYISSKKNSYCILIRSAEHAAMTKALFEGIWRRAKMF